MHWILISSVTYFSFYYLPAPQTSSFSGLCQNSTSLTSQTPGIKFLLNTIHIKGRNSCQNATCAQRRQWVSVKSKMCFKNIYHATFLHCWNFLKNCMLFKWHNLIFLIDICHTTEGESRQRKLLAILNMLRFYIFVNCWISCFDGFENK